MLPAMHVQTMFVFIILMCVSLAISAGLVAGRDDEDGLRTWSVALYLHAVGYALLTGRGTLPDALSVVLANAALSASLSVFGLAIDRFIARRIAWLRLWLPPLLLIAAFLPFGDDLRVRIIVGNAILGVQAVMLIAGLAAVPLGFASRGRMVVVASLGLIAAMLATRIAAAVLDPGAIVSLFSETPIQTATYFTAFVSIILVSNGFLMMARERSQERLRTAAMKDKLTGCWNRVRIEEAARQEMARLERYGHPVAMVMMDLDHFKDINDRHGHAAGDMILRGFADVARESIRTTDLLGRWGGEEFVVLLPHCGFPEAVWIAERIRRNLEDGVFPGGLRVTASLGVAVCQSGDTWDAWIGRADAALYRAKAGGRNRVLADGADIEAGDPLVADPPVLQLHWRPEYDTGHPVIDGQHRALFAAANTVLLAGRDEGRRDAVEAAMKALVAEVREHMAAETAILAALGHAEADAHAAHHDRLLERTDRITAWHAAGRLGNAELIHFVVYELIAQHILLEDRKFAGLRAATEAAEA
jgi:diguanylate cyclase (GGDEF)-like protein/hemerythrin-like metal-binding protein